MRKEYDIKKLKVKRRGIMPELSGQKMAKVRITISVDQDIVEYFKDLAAEPGALPYQTQINQVLRQAMEAPAKKEIEYLKCELLRDKRFIKKLAENIPKS